MSSLMLHMRAYLQLRISGADLSATARPRAHAVRIAVAILLDVAHVHQLPIRLDVAIGPPHLLRNNGCC